MIYNMVGGGASGGLPEFTYTGMYKFIDDGDKNWRIKFLTSGTLVFSKLGNAAKGIDVFCAGGGAGGSFLTGGGSGYTKTVKKVYPSKNTEYSIIIGAGGNGYNGSSATNGGSTSALNVTANGGYAGTYNGKGGNGGSGGAGSGNNLSGGSDGSDGAAGPGSDGNGGAASPGIGQHTTTKEFGDESGKLYASGGGTSGHYGTGSSASANTGDGGQGSGTVNSGGAPNAGNGGSGIAVIRNSR